MPHHRDGPTAAQQPPQQQHQQQQCSPVSPSAGSSARRREAQEPAVSYSSTEDFISKVEIYRGRHSVVWNVVCKASRRPLILKAYMKASGGGHGLGSGPGGR